MVEKRILHYRILELLGQGAMGTVYKAMDERIETYRALKFIKTESAHVPKALAGIHREARLQGKLFHPNIAAILALEMTDDGDFLVMEYVDGENLGLYLQHRSPIIEHRLTLLLQITAALDAAHQNGIIHRDIKPSNVLVTSKGIAKVTDFGLAKAIGQTTITTTLSVKGTAPYMPPEAFRGSDVGKSGDVWSLGVLAFELFEGVRPFSGNNFEALGYQILNESPRVLSPQTTEVIPGIASWIGTCLEKDTQDRYEDCSVAFSQLVEISREFDLDSKVFLQTMSWSSPRKRLNKRRFSAGIAIGILLLATLLLVFSTQQLPILDDLSWIQWSDSVDIQSPSWDGPGEQLAYISGSQPSEIHILDTLQPRPVATAIPLTFSDTPRYVAWAPDRSYLAVCGRAGVYICDTQSQEQYLIYEGRMRYPAWSEGGEWLAFIPLAEVNTVIITGPFSNTLDESITSLEFRIINPEGIVRTGNLPALYNPTFIMGDSLLAFATDRKAENLGIWAVPVSGGTAMRLVSDIYSPWNLDWDRKTRTLLFSRNNMPGLWFARLSRDGQPVSDIGSLGGDEILEDFDYNQNSGRYVLYSFQEMMHIWMTHLDSEDSTWDPLIEDFALTYSLALTADQEHLLFCAVDHQFGKRLISYSHLSGNIRDLYESNFRYYDEWCPTPDPLSDQYVILRATSGNSTGLYYHDLKSGVFGILKSNPPEGRIQNPFWAQDGSQIYYNVWYPGEQNRSEIRRLTISRADGRLIPEADSLIYLNQNCIYPLLAPEAGHILFQKRTTGIDSLYILELETGRVHPLTAGRTPTLNPSGNILYFYRDRSIYSINRWQDSLIRSPTIEIVIGLPAGIDNLATDRPIAVSDSTIYATLRQQSAGRLKWSTTKGGNITYEELQ